jgi:hypothetical protein
VSDSLSRYLSSLCSTSKGALGCTPVIVREIGRAPYALPSDSFRLPFERKGGGAFVLEVITPSDVGPGDKDFFKE